MNQQYKEPHRGGLILAFAILGFVLCFVFTPIAWILGRGDLKKMDYGLMDESGRSITEAGVIVAIVHLWILALSVVVALLLLFLFLLMGMLSFSPELFT